MKKKKMEQKEKTKQNYQTLTKAMISLTIPCASWLVIKKSVKESAICACQSAKAGSFVKKTKNLLLFQLRNSPKLAS